MYLIVFKAGNMFL